MAQLNSYFRLCPLIDTKSLLGVSEDCEKGTALVTLGKNMAIKYRLSDQKQIYSWRTKEKFTSPVLYDKIHAKHVAVFNNTFIRFWDDSDEYLDKVKKYKFNTHIHTLIPHEDGTYILFENGALYPLNNILDDRKSLEIDDIINSNDQIHDICHVTVKEDFYLGYMVQKVLYWTKCRNLNNKFASILIKRDGYDLCGYTFHLDENQSLQLLTIWNDGHMYSHNLHDTDNNDEIDSLSFNDIHTVLRTFCGDQSVLMTSLGDNYIALFGADINQEGATLMIFNTHFKVIASKQSHKLFNNDAKLWKIQNNLILPIGQNLVVIPFRLESEQLASLVGTHKVLDSNNDNNEIQVVQPFEIVEWNNKTRGKKSNKKLKTKTEFLSEYIEQGLSENQVVGQVLVEILENNNINLLKQLLITFMDIPEQCLVKILKYLLSDHNGSDTAELLNLVLRRDFSEALIIPHLHNQLSLEDVIKLLEHIKSLLTDPHAASFLRCTQIQTEDKLIGWSSVIIDANYQKFFLSTDSNVKRVLNAFSEVVNAELTMFSNIERVVPVLMFLRTGKLQAIQNGATNARYSVEQVCFY